MTQAAILIQSKFRSYYEQKRFQQSRRAAVLIQQHYRSYRRRPSGSLPARNKYGPGPETLCYQLCLCPLPVLICPSLLGFLRGRGHGMLAYSMNSPHLFLLNSTRSSFLTKKQDQAARKIMRFLRRCRHRYWSFPSLDFYPATSTDSPGSSDCFLISPQDEGIEAEPGAGRASPAGTGHLTLPQLSHHPGDASWQS